MGKDPAVLFYTADFLSGTILMDYEQRGKYITLLCLQHQKGVLCEKDMFKICGEYDEDVFSKFCKSDDGLYYNKRMLDEAEKRKKYSESRSNNRKKKKTEDMSNDVNNTSKSYVSHMENENINENINDIKDIIDYLNIALGTKYRYTTKSIQTHIRARLREGFTVDDFKCVIDKKKRSWMGTDSQKFLRPDTLFGGKFQSYLNEIEKESSFDVDDFWGAALNRSLGGN